MMGSHLGERMPKAAAPLSLLTVEPLGCMENLCGKPQKGHEVGQGRDQGMLVELVMVGRAAGDISIHALPLLALKCFWDPLPRA